MRRFLESEIWTDPKVRQLEPLGKLLLVYLINNNLGHMSGIYVLPEILITSQTGIKQTELDKQWKALSMLDIADRDQSTETVWVVNMLKHQGHDNPTPKTVAAVESQLKRVHGSKLISIFLDHYQDWNIQYNGHIPHTCPIDGESEGIQSKNMSGSISKSNTTNPNPNPNSNSKTEETTTRKQRSGTDIEDFCRNAQNVLDLWDEMVKPLGFPNAPKMSGGIAKQIREACAVLKTKQDWIDLFTEYRHSKWLRGEANSASSRKRDFSWIFQRENNGSTENYVKIHNGRYRDRHEDDMDPLTRRNFEAAEQALNRMGIPTKAQTFILKGIADGRTVQDGNSGIPGEVGDGLWTDAEYCEDRDLPGGPGGVYAGAGADGDYLGQEESREISDDRGFEDSDRGE